MLVLVLSLFNKVCLKNQKWGWLSCRVCEHRGLSVLFPCVTGSVQLLLCQKLRRTPHCWHCLVFRDPATWGLCGTGTQVTSRSMSLQAHGGLGEAGYLIQY